MFNEKNRTKQLSGIISEVSEPSWETRPERGKTYVVMTIPHEGHSFYLVPNGTKKKDFGPGGKFYEWTQDYDPRMSITCIVKVTD